MEAKIAWKSKNMRKKAWRKSMLKFDAEKKANVDSEVDFGSISVAYGNIPAPGLRKEKARSQDFFRIVFWMDTEGLQQKLL